MVVQYWFTTVKQKNNGGVNEEEMDLAEQNWTKIHVESQNEHFLKMADPNNLPFESIWLFI